MQTTLGPAASVLVDRLRHLGTELASCRQQPDWQRIAGRITHRIEVALQDAYRERLLPPSLLDCVDQHNQRPKVGKGRGFHFGNLYVSLLLGYHRVDELPIDDDLSGTFLAIGPAAIDTEWPGVFPLIYGNESLYEPAMGEAELLEELQYDIAGYRSHACKKIADWIEGNPVPRCLFLGLTPREERFVAYLQANPNGVTYQEFCDATWEGKELTNAMPNSLRSMLAKLSGKLEEYAYAIECPRRENRIRMVSLSECK